MERIRNSPKLEDCIKFVVINCINSYVSDEKSRRIKIAMDNNAYKRIFKEDNRSV